jgi:hypothetical protein
MTKITSSGVIRNADKPRVGIISANALDSSIYDEIDQGIDLTFEEFCQELKDQGIEIDSEQWWIELESYENDSRIVLFGDWIKNGVGQYEPDKSGLKGYAASYNSDSGIICVEWSKTFKQCHHTSPCYVMANGDGPCGDLETDGDAVIAFDLPKDYKEV